MVNHNLKDVAQSIKRTCKYFLGSTHFSTIAIAVAVSTAALLFANITPASLSDPFNAPDAMKPKDRLDLEDSMAQYRLAEQLPALAANEQAEQSEQAQAENPQWPAGYSKLEGELRSGETLGNALRRVQINGSNHSRVINALDGLLDFRALRPGDRFKAVFDQQDTLVEYRYHAGPFDVYRVQRTDDDQFLAEKMPLTLERRTKMISGRVSSSLFAAFQPHGEQARLIYSFADIFASRMDFNTETRVGDHFQMVFEKYYREDEFVGYGPITYARYQQAGGEILEAFRFAPPDSKASYFDPDGRELGASFLRSPVPMARVTSGFNRRRLHPILNEVRPHLAVDLAAPTGTPVMATADGRVRFRARDGGNGNLVILEHSNGYRSYYAHLNGFKRGLKVGDRVRQRDIIGYVGATGLATGPHVCYRIRHNGEFIDPMGLRFTPRSVLEGETLAMFREQLRETKQLAQKLDRGDRQVMVSRITVGPDQRPAML